MQFKTETIVGAFVLIALVIFFYITFFLGVFRVDRFSYNTFSVAFDNISGLEKKADVKIAGVKVGWVENICLTQNDYRAQAIIKIHNAYHVRLDAQVFIKQDSVLGSKYLELVPGNPDLPKIVNGTTLEKPGIAPPGVDDILEKMQTLAATVDKTLQQNEHAISEIIQNFEGFTRDLKNAFPSIDREIGAVAQKFFSTAQMLNEAAQEARDGFRQVGSVIQKIDHGQGALGKLVNHDEVYRDIRQTIKGIKKYVTKVEDLNIVFDSHSEYMYKPAEHVNFEDAKGYLDIRIHPNDDHFYLVQILSTQRGNLKRTIKENKWFDERCVEILPSQFIDLPRKSAFLPELVGTVETRKRKLDQLKFGVQIGKIFKDLAFRIGIMESSAGFGIDINVPCWTEKIRWISTFEAFDFKGRDRINDKRPHFKWINRLFFLRNVYLVAGADDFISKENANGFFGAGIRFCDDDLKYFLSAIGAGGMIR